MLEYMDEAKCLLKQKDFYLLIAGETSSGKSTILNLILGEDAVPHHTLCSTSTICEVKYGEVRTVVLHEKPKSCVDSRPTPKTIQLHESFCKSYAEQMESYVCLQENERKMGKYEKVEIFWPHDFLKQGVVIVDSPGLGESEQMDEVLMNYLPNAFAFIYILDVSRAGGLQKESTIKMKKIAEKLLDFNDGLHKGSSLQESTLFIANKWDQVGEDKKESVRSHIAKVLSKCLDKSNVEKHIITMSATNSLKVQQCGGITPEFNILLDSIGQLIVRAVNLKLYSSWRTLDMIIWQVIRLADYFKHQAKDSIRRYSIIESRIKDIQDQEKNERKLLEIDLDPATETVSNKMKDYIKTEDFKNSFLTWNTIGVEKLRGKNWETTRENVEEAISEKFSLLLRDWEINEQVYEKTHWMIVNNYLKKFSLLKEELDKMSTCIDDKMEENEQSDLSLSTKILFGLSFPLWLPFAAAGVLISAPILAPIVVTRRLSTNNNMKELLNYVKRRSEKFLNEKLAEEVLEEAKQLTQKTRKKLNPYSSLIPRVIEADKKMVVKLRNETRSNQELAEKYTPIQKEGGELRKRMISLGWELLPATINRRDVRWDNTYRAEIGEGDFSRVYRGMINTSTAEPHLSKVAVKVFKHLFDDLNVRFYIDEEALLRCLKHENVLPFIGAVKEEIIKDDGSKHLIHAFVLPLCKKNFRKVVMDDNDVIPANSNNVNAAIEKFVSWIKGIANGLQYIHEMGLVHRHLKLENILMNENGEPAISDIGISGQFYVTERSMIYLAPEVLKSFDNMKKEADIYSFSILLWEMWHGDKAFESLDQLEQMISN
ncbi:dual serine/threonine and tyrosine protein kinase-like isoform X2 [Xenia sp. Carnegie-2017]|uniref:dual serine/threonine and tyrosine protein kinase-like isoform X2 n=1 Tax=Xenia sp. Carnegie-2017 TaxID=2897299 RepID=UPI001F035CEC|nr:dual serine/threonine and tyrosine protein kinase-like isoform X2 [Xenia sp. Carnegie-2017]